MQLLTRPEQAANWLREHVQGDLHADSRVLRPGDGFVAWPGAVADGRKFVPSALQQGAAACLVEAHEVAAWGLDKLQEARKVACYAGLKAATGPVAHAFYRAPSAALDVVAITGTNGKTSTAWWLAEALSALEVPAAMIGTLGAGIVRSTLAVGDPLAALAATGLTTPDPVSLQRLLRGFADQGVRVCAMEASSIGLAEGRMDATRVRVAVFTNFTQDHLDYHGSMESYWAAKAMLFRWPGLQASVVHTDGEAGAQLARQLEAAGQVVWTTSCQSPARLQAVDIALGLSGVAFTVVEGEVRHRVETGLVGAYNVANVLGVMGAMRALGVPLADAARACGRLGPVPGRMECVGAPGQPLVVVDYAHTPDALEKALRALRPMAQARGGRLWCVFGCGGNRDATKRPLMGAVAEQSADELLVTSDNPRDERPQAIIGQVLLGLTRPAAARVQVDRALAIGEAVAAAGPHDVLLLAGKGHETYQESGGIRSPFSDRQLAQEALNRRSPTEGRP